MIVTGIVGLPGAGKDTLADYFSDRLGMEKISTGDLLRAEAEKLELEPTREALQQLAADRMKEHGPEWMGELLLETLETEEGEQFVITGIRTPADVEVLQNELQSSFMLIAVLTLDPGMRFARIQHRGGERDAVSYEQFMRDEQAEVECFELNETLELADVQIFNNDSLQSFHVRIENELIPVLQMEDGYEDMDLDL